MAAAEILSRRRARESFAGYIERFSWEPPPARHHRIIIAEIDRVLAGENNRLMIFQPPGGGKALAVDTPIPTPTGWARIGDLCVGDQVFDDSGHPCRVTWRSPVFKNRPVYRVRTDCGDEIIADAEHEWPVVLSRKPREPLIANGLGRPPRSDRDDPRSRVTIHTTRFLCRRRSKRPMIRRAASLELPDADLPIAPYLLGLWLGDGDSQQIAITAGNDDSRWFQEKLQALTYSISDRAKTMSFGVLGVRNQFVRLGLLYDPLHATLGRKYIPQSYLRGSRIQRLELLRGLIDSDGWVCRQRGNTTFSSSDRGLAEGVRELVRSLGVKAGWAEGRATLRGKDCGPHYRVSFYLEGSASLPRKAALTRNQRRTPNTYIDVEPAGRADTVCIEVDSPTHLFLAGRSMTPTHNSHYTSIMLPPYFMAQHPHARIIAGSHTIDLAKYFGRKSRNIAASREFARTYDAILTRDAEAAGEWALTNGAEYLAAGVRSPIAGRRASLGLIDDPVKSKADALSVRYRNAVWDWYVSDFRTRLLPDAAIILIQTRWSYDDLAGRILPEDYDFRSGDVVSRSGETWRVISIPALIETAAQAEADLLGRGAGESYWPGWWRADLLVQEKAERPAWDWAALYQQRPSPEEGDYFKREWFRWYDTPPPRAQMAVYGASDYAVAKDEGQDPDWTVHIVVGVDPEGNIYVLDLWRGRTDSDIWIETWLSLNKRWHPREWGEEKGQIRRAIGPFLRRRQHEAGVWTTRRGFATVGDKAMRAQSIRGRCAMGMVYLPKNAPWVEDFLGELLTFPAGVHDDQVDAFAWIGHLLPMMDKGKRPAPPPQPITTIEDVRMERLWEDLERGIER